MEIDFTDDTLSSLTDYIYNVESLYLDRFRLDRNDLNENGLIHTIKQWEYFTNFVENEND